jgi:parallel beta-helix repeat protein
MIRKSTSAAVIFILVNWGAGAANLYVATGGRTGWSGRLPEPNAQGTDGPLPSLVTARDAARAMRSRGTSEPVTIFIRGGAYVLSQPFVLLPEDSDTTYAAYLNERPVISGGQRIDGWKKTKGAIWIAPAPRYFRQLFVNGRRAQRARTPNNGFFRIEGPSSQDKPFQLKFRGNDIRQEWAERGDVEVVAMLAWADIRMPIVQVNEETHVATLTGEPRRSNKEKDARYYIENAPDALDSPGEWYLDRKSSTVSYWTMPGEDLSRDEVIAPALLQLVRLEGKPERGQFVRNVSFRGLDFRFTDWDMTPHGYADTQAASAVGAVLEAVGAENVTVENCTFLHHGSYAIWFGRGSRRNQVTGTEIFDMGAGGIRLGDLKQSQNEAEQNSNNVVRDNHIHDLGLVYCPAVGVFIAQSNRNTVSHNHIHNLFYTAISAGWTWGYGPNQSKGNRIEYNHLHHIGQDMLSDMGAIYTLGVQPGTLIRNNLIHDVSSFTYGGWGIYPDEGSSDMVIENNIVYGCKSAGFHQHYGARNLVRNNIFAFNKEQEVMRSKAEDHLSFTFEGNIVYFDQGRLLGGNWTGDQYRFNRNVYYDARGGKIYLTGQDTQSVIADPLFVNAGNYDFRLRPNSPALRLGFKPIDLKDVGPRVVTGVEGYTPTGR